MEVLIWILLLIAVMWVFQLYMAVKQSQRFADALKEIRTPGTTRPECTNVTTQPLIG